jgi:Uma2 family endonuclease
VTRLKVQTLTIDDYERAALEYLRSLPLEHFMEARSPATQREITLESLALLRAQRPEVHVFNEMLVQYPLGGGIGQVVPDNMIVLSTKPIRAEGSFNVPFESARPFFVLEYVSSARPRKDYEESFQKYEKELRVPYCLLYYPQRQDLRVYRHGGRKYKLLKPNVAGRFAIPELDLEIGLHEGWVRFWYRGQLLGLPAELQQRLDIAELQLDVTRQQLDVTRQQAEQARQQAEQQRQQAEQARQQAEQQRQQAEQERQQTRREKRRTVKERERRLAAEAEVERLRRLVEQLERRRQGRELEAE